MRRRTRLSPSVSRLNAMPFFAAMLATAVMGLPVALIVHPPGQAGSEASRSLRPRTHVPVEVDEQAIHQMILARWKASVGHPIVVAEELGALDERELTRIRQQFGEILVSPRRTLLPTEGVVLVSEAALDEIFREGCREGWERFDATFPDLHCLHRLTVIAFDADRRRAAVGLSFVCGPLAGRGCVLLLEWRDDQWVETGVATLWVS